MKQAFVYGKNCPFLQHSCCLVCRDCNSHNSKMLLHLTKDYYYCLTMCVRVENIVYSVCCI